MRTGLRLDDEVRGWKLFVLAPRMLLYRSPGEARVPPTELDRRVELFRAGRWNELLRKASAAAAAPPSRQRGDPGTDEAHAHRAAALVHLGELSAAARALTAEPLAPGTSDTLAELRDPARRPPEPYAPLAEATLRHAPDHPCPLPQLAFLECLRSARRGSAAGPSGATNEHRLVALRKPNGCVRALVVGDVLRRLLGRALAQHFAPHFQSACLPHQFGLSTRVGTEAVNRLLRAATEANPRATVLSVDAVGALDHVARGAMLDALLANPELQPLLPYARQFYASPSTYTWYDEDGAAHNVHQGEGGEQGDPLMPAFYALAQHPALHDLHTQLQDGEAVFAFLDDVYVVAPPERVRVLYDALAAALWAHARIGCTRARPGSGMLPARNHPTSPTLQPIPNPSG